MSGNLPRDDAKKKEKKPAEKPEFDFSDIAAFSIAALQLILPAAAIFFGLFYLLYLLLNYWAK